MDGRWTITRRASCTSSGDDWHIAAGPDPGAGHPGVPVVPCDDAAVERVACWFYETDESVRTMDAARGCAEAVLAVARGRER